jgi:ubiquitin C-terminal hydrolase
MSFDDEVLKAPTSAAPAFEKLKESCGLSYAAFTVLKQSERDVVLAAFSTEEIAAITEAVNRDERKIYVRRCDYAIEIAQAVQAASFQEHPVQQGCVVGPKTVDGEVIVNAVATAPPASPERPSTPANEIICLPDRTSYPTPPPVSPTSAADDFYSKPNYAGIVNQGNTCYLNSMLQALFHVPYFRSMMMYRISANCTDPIPVALRNLFMQLELRAPMISTKELTHAFGWSAEEAARQHDVHELAQVLFDSLENILKNTPDHDAIKSLFFGAQTYYTRCLDADFTSRRQEGLYDVELTVKGHDSLTNSFEFYVRPEKIDGKYCWEHEDGTKSYHEAERGVLFDRLPPVLMIHPNRVDFDMERMERVTVSTKWTFPVEIDLGPFVSTPAAGCATPAASASSLEERQDSFGELLSTEYVLRSVIIHSGTAMYGHYYCYVRLDDGKWVCFNDNTVSHVSEATVFSKAFSGPVIYSSYAYPASERATLLLYLNKSVLDKLLSCPAPEEAVLQAACKEIEIRRKEREEAERLERCRVTMKYVVIDDDGDYLVYLEDGKAEQQLKPRSVTYINNFSKEMDQDPSAVIAKDLGVAPSDILLWSYSYLPLYSHEDGATIYAPPTYTSYSSYSYSTVKFVQILKKTPATETEAADVLDIAVGSNPLATAPTPVSGKGLYHVRIWNGAFFKYAGVAKTKSELKAMVNGLEVPADPEAKAPSTSTHTASFKVSEDDLAANEQPKEPPAPSWSFYTVANKAANTLRWDYVANGANVVVAPSYMAGSTLVKLLSRKVETEVDVVRLLPNGTLLDLFRIPMEQKAQLDAMQNQIFSKLVELGLPRPESPLFIGLRDCDATGEPKSSIAHTLQSPFYSSYYAEYKTTLQSHLRIGSTKLCVEFLPLSMVEVDKRLHINILFNFSTQYHRFVLIPSDLTSWADVEAEALRQWHLDPKAPAIPTGAALRLLTLDYWGKLKPPPAAAPTTVYLARHETYIIDVVLPAPAPPVGEPDVQPLLVNVQHVNRYSGETYFGRPTNTYLFPQSEQETGEAILKRTLDKIEITDPATRDQCLRTWKVCLRLPIGIKVMGRTDVLKSLLPSTEPLLDLSILLDHVPHGAAKAASREHAIQIRHSPIPQN